MRYSCNARGRLWSPEICAVGGRTPPTPVGLGCQGQGTETATQSNLMQAQQLASCTGGRNVEVLR